MKTLAILMAAGMGTRMRPLTETKPKPLVEVCGKPMIETVIQGLLKRPVDEIYVVTGYLSEQFDYLTEKYPQVHLIVNREYSTRNNISSVYAAREILRRGNCFICESDLFIPDSSVFRKELPQSCYYGCMRRGITEDWVFELNGNRISRVGKGGKDTYHMVGVAYFCRRDAALLADYMEEAYRKPENSQLFWDEVVDAHLSSFELRVEPVQEGQIIEIDTVEELNKVNESRGFVTAN